MVIHCKIGTMPGSYLRVRRINRVLYVGDVIYGMDYFEWKKNRYYRKWERFVVTHYRVDHSIYEVFYFLSR